MAPPRFGAALVAALMATSASALDLNGKFSYTGCFTDKGTRILSGKSKTSASMSLNVCGDFCGDDYQYFGTEYGSECYCGNAILNQAQNQLSTDITTPGVCTMNCAGESTQKCGKGSQMSIYTNNAYVVPTVQAPPNSQSLGCFKDSGKPHPLPVQKTSTSPMTATVCKSLCGTDYAYFGLEYGSECWCGNAAPDATLAADLSECSKTCAGDRTQLCGASSRLNVFSNGDYKAKAFAAENDDLVHLGCYVDDGSHPLPSLRVSTLDMTAAVCQTHCADYKYFGTEYGSECYCGNTIPPVAAQSATECKQSCSGNSKELCGASNRLDVYVNKHYVEKTHATLDGVPYIGCYQDNINTRVLSGALHYSKDMTASKCHDLCSDYTHFGTEFGEQCWCGNADPARTLVTVESDCSTICTGNTNEVCGANTKLSVYGFASVAEYEREGCFVEHPSRLLTAKSYTDDVGMTLDTCASFCHDFPYFGVEYSSECYCGWSLPAAAEPATDASCAAKCKGSDEFCGGTWFISVYKNPSFVFPESKAEVAGFAYDGCYTDAIPRVLQGPNSTGGSANSLEACAAFCTAAGQAYFGVEYANECYCGNDLILGAQKVADEKCDMPCGSDSSEACGGLWTISVYKTEVVGQEQ